MSVRNITKLLHEQGEKDNSSNFPALILELALDTWELFLKWVRNGNKLQNKQQQKRKIIKLKVMIPSYDETNVLYTYRGTTERHCRKNLK